jgi:1-acyl-sn-glycerol-3-phosphate acyltransferase
MALWTDPRITVLGDRVPRAHSRLASAFGRLMMGLWGWRMEGAVENVPRMVLIVAPHTSNWDFPVGLLAKLAMRLEGRFIGKHTLFRWPFGVFLRAIGGIPVDRTRAQGVVDEAARIIRAADGFVLVIAPEGTRRRTEKWKSGFYRIAMAAQVPILLVAFDWPKKVVRMGPMFTPTGDYERDLPLIQAHFDASMAFYPRNY